MNAELFNVLLSLIERVATDAPGIIAKLKNSGAQTPAEIDALEARAKALFASAHWQTDDQVDATVPGGNGGAGDPADTLPGD